MRNKIIEHGVYGYFLSIAHSLVPKTCSKVYKPKYDTGTNNTLFVYLLFCKNLPTSISKRGFVLLHTFNGWHTFDHYFPFPILPRGRSIEDYKVDSEAKAICIFICANSISTPCARLFLDSSM